MAVHQRIGIILRFKAKPAAGPENSAVFANRHAVQEIIEDNDDDISSYDATKGLLTHHIDGQNSLIPRAAFTCRIHNRDRQIKSICQYLLSNNRRLEHPALHNHDIRFDAFFPLFPAQILYVMPYKAA